MTPERDNAIELLRQAAWLGNADAQFKLGVILCRGEAPAADLDQAVQWYRRAAAQGHAYAQHNLAVMTLKGQGTAPNDTAAFDWVAKAAAQGITEAQNLLGELYRVSRGTAADPAAARRWYAGAAERGSAVAAAKLKELGATTATPASTNVAPQRKDGRTGTIAIITMAYNENVNRPIWRRHYRGFAPSAALFVIDHGSDDHSTDHLSGINVIPIPRENMDERDLDLPAALQQHFAHNLMGIYAEVHQAGEIAEGAGLALQP